MQHELQERKRAEKTRRSSQARFAGILDLAQDAVISVAEDQRITMFNQGAERIFGYSAREALGQPLDVLLPARLGDVHGAHVAGFANGPDSAKWTEERREVFGRRKDGTEFVGEASLSKLELEGAKILTIMLRDVTERKLAEEAIRDSNRQLAETLDELKQTQYRVVQQERLRALGEMASGIAHDFNNTLLPIVGYTELLIEDSLDDREKALEYLNTVRTAAKDAGNVVKRLREFYRAREEKEVFGLLDLNALVRETINLTQPKWKDQAQAKGSNVTIKTDLQETPMLPGDDSSLRDALTNLIMNAVDAMPDGGDITIRTLRNEDWAVVEVSDTGVGMSDEVRRRCLDPFFTTKGDQGTGLGLSMVHGIAKRHGGSIYIESTPGEGTTFILRLPTGSGLEAVVPPEPKEDSKRSPLHILAVDDDATSLMVIVDSLMADGHSVDSASTGREALEQFRSDSYDVVFTDRAMPDMNGDQVAEAIKHASPETPVIMLTGFGDVMTYAGEKPDGVDLVAAKPASLSDLRAALAEVLV